MRQWREEASVLLHRMEDAFSKQRPTPLYQKLILALLMIGFAGALIRLFVRA